MIFKIYLPNYQVVFVLGHHSIIAKKPGLSKEESHAPSRAQIDEI